MSENESEERVQPPECPRDWVDQVQRLAAVFAALALLGLLAWGYAFVMGKAGTAAETWARYMSMLRGAEVVVFAGASFLFGATVQRQVDKKTVEKAETQAGREETKREKAEAQERRTAELATALSTSVMAATGPGVGGIATIAGQPKGQPGQPGQTATGDFGMARSLARQILEREGMKLHGSE